MKILLILSVVLFLGCERDHVQKQLSASQLNAVAKMESSYQLAKLYNDSLANAVNGTIRNSDSTAIHYFDSMYHYYNSQFETYHGQYEHTNTSADHSHNSTGQVQMHNSGNGMMDNCKCCSNGGHKADIHQKMTALTDTHKLYHPKHGA